MPKKPVVTTNNGLFLVLGVTYAGATNFTLRRLSIPSCRSSPTWKARGSNPPGRTKSSTLWGAALFVLHGFYGAVKEGLRTARAPRFASRGAETPQWGVSRARLGVSLRAHSKTSLQCVFAMRFFLYCYSGFRIILAAYHLPHPCTDLLPAVRFSANLW